MSVTLPSHVVRVLIVIVSIPIFTVQGQRDDCTVTIQNGTVIGAIGDTINPGKKVCSYLGIPFAAPPVGPLRFRPPQPAPGWTTPINATTSPNWCPQPGDNPPGIVTSEDCLYLNIYHPNIEDISTANLPVLVWIHGGGFIRSQTLPWYTPERLLARGDAILVVLHYRMGVLGFLSTGDDAAPGNYGLKDQAQALRWVNENIKAFGGNPEKVTLFGESAGAASVIYQLVSPLNSGLIHRAIAQSWSELKTFDPDPFTSAKSMAERHGCQETDTSQQIIDCLANPSWEEIIEKQSEYQGECYATLSYPYATLTPVVEPDLPGAFITQEPMDMIKSGELDTSIPVMLGANRHEGSFMLGSLYLSYFGPRGLDRDPVYMREQIVPDLLKYYGITGDEANRAVASTLEMAYLSGVDRSSWNESMPGLVDMLSVLNFKSVIQSTAELLSSRGSPVYLYAFEHHSENTVWDVMFGFGRAGVPVDHGITHGDVIIYQFGVPAQFSRADESFSETLCDIWINFAEEGNPTPEPDQRYEQWPTYTSSDELYMYLNLTPTVQSGYRNTWRPNGFEWD